MIAVDSRNGRATTKEPVFDAGQITNAAGLFADQVTGSSGLQISDQCQPFK